MKKGRLLILAITFVAVVGLLGACAGDIGPVGSVGPQGTVGEQGPQGEDGSQGLTGEAGLQGEPGLEGSQGLPGADGADGSDGAPGTPGATGAIGATGGGPRGTQGIQGIPGPQGIVSGIVISFTTIQAAIDAASPGATITIPAGIYYEQLVINKSLTLLGANAGVPATGIRSSESIIDAGTALVAVLVDNVAVESVVIDGFTISNFGKAGIVVKNVLAVQIDNNIVSTTIHTAAPNGIQIGYVMDLTATTGTIRGNRVSDSTWYLYDSDVPDAYEGELPGGGTNWTGSGILVIAPNSELAISHNEVFGNDVGLDIEAGSLTILSDNDVHDNSYGFILWNADSSINFNNIYGNGLFGVYRTTQAPLTGTLDATNNWWGDASGPSHASNPSGTGGAVTDNVNFADWLVAPNP